MHLHTYKLHSCSLNEYLVPNTFLNSVLPNVCCSVWANRISPVVICIFCMTTEDLCTFLSVKALLISAFL